MKSLIQALAKAGKKTPFSFQSGFQTYPNSLKEIMRTLNLPAPDLDTLEPDPDDPDYFYSFEESNAQGIAFAHGHKWFLSSERRIFRYLITGPDTFRPASVRREKSVRLDHLVTTARVPLDPDPYGGFGGGYADLQGIYVHIGDISYSQGVVFAPIENTLWSDPDLIFGLDENLRLVAWAELDLTSANSLCAVHPWNGYLYAMGKGNNTGELQAYDVSKFISHLQEPAQWGVRVDMARRPYADIQLRTPTGDPDRQGAQGLTFSSNGRIYLTRSHGDSDGPWDNRLYAYSALTGNLFGKSREYDFPSPIGRDEIEGIAIHPSGILYVAVADNKLSDSDDDFDLYTLRFRNLRSDAI